MHYHIDNPGKTIYAYPTNQALANWTTHRVEMVEDADPNTGRYSATLADGDWVLFDGADEPTSFANAIEGSLVTVSSGLTFIDTTLSLSLATGQTVYAYPLSESLTNWTTNRIALTETNGLYSTTLTSESGITWAIFIGANQPADWSPAIAAVTLDVESEPSGTVISGSSFGTTKFQKKPSEEKAFIISAETVLSKDVTIATIDNISLSPVGMTHNSGTILSSGRDISIHLGGGVNRYEYLLNITITDSDGNEKQILATVVVSDSVITDKTLYYGSTWEGDEYFSDRLNSDEWDDAEIPNKRAALIEATRLIDRLNFKGSKSVASQTLQFPRGSDTEVPLVIRQATYELAYQLLNDVNPDHEYDDLRTVEDRYVSVKRVQDTSWSPEHIQAGIPSSRAWHLLKPFLRDSKHLHLRRG